MNLPSNGNVRYSGEITAGKFKPGTILTYSCDIGYYTLMGSFTRTCQPTGRWTGSHVVCRKGNGNQATSRSVTMTMMTVHFNAWECCPLRQ